MSDCVHATESHSGKSELATKHRAAVARVLHLAQDRLILGVAAVELAKTMAIPRKGDNERLKHVARYLHGNLDYVQWYPFQTQLSCPQMPIGPHVTKHVVQIQEAL